MSPPAPPHMREPRMLREAPILVGVAGFLSLAAVGYWFLSYEDAGSVMLLLASATVWIMAGYVILSRRRAETPAAGADAGAEPYLPHASVWPFAVGAGAIVVGNGLALGLWAVVVGGLVLGGGLLGYAAQSRRRR